MTSRTETSLLRQDDIVVTGLGATTPVGGDVKSFWAGLLEGRSGVVALEQDWARDLSVRIAAPMAVDPTEIIPRVQSGGWTAASRQPWSRRARRGRTRASLVGPATPVWTRPGSRSSSAPGSAV